jgi:hypothetical protein
VQVTEGAISVNGIEIRAGDGAAVEGERALEIAGTGEFLLFDLN